MRDKELLKDLSSLPVKIFQRIRASRTKTPSLLLVKFRVYLQDRPGSLADFALYISASKANISFFHYDRSVHSNRVVVEVQLTKNDDLAKLLDFLKQNNSMFEETPVLKDDVQITSIENVLEIKVRLKNEPGTLAAFANLLKEHEANVLYILYDEDIDPESANIAMATKDLREIDRLLGAINNAGYYYRVVYRGTEEKEAVHIIGLKLVEKFFLKLRKLLPDREFDEIRSIVDSSQEWYSDLVHFYEESGNYLEAGDVFEKILALASKSRSRVGDRFAAVEMPPLQISDQVVLYGLRLPTTENIYLFRQGDEITFIDAGYGIYYKDIKKFMQGKLMDPAMVKRIFLTHPDADHAGTAGYFQEEFGTQVFMHPESRGVIEQNNRAFGLQGKLANLNRYYTRLINKFTECRFPEQVRYFSVSKIGRTGAFTFIDTFAIGNLVFEVLESHGGHIPGHVFFLNKEYGLLFTSDFLINVQSLSSEDRDILGVYRYLLTNPNSDHQIYKKESDNLRDVIMTLDADLKQSGRHMTVFPGHGYYYRADMFPRRK